MTKSSMLYGLIDQSDNFYVCPVEEKYRSRMNVTLRVGGPSGDKELEEKFVQEASLRGMLSLKGHRYVNTWEELNVNIIKYFSWHIIDLLGD